MAHRPSRLSNSSIVDPQPGTSTCSQLQPAHDWWIHRRPEVIPEMRSDHKASSSVDSTSSLLSHIAKPPLLDEERPDRLTALTLAKSIISRIGRLFDLRLWCLLLHFSLLAIHVALLFVWKHNLEHKVIFDLGQASNFASTTITVLLQSFGTIYSALMVYTAQQLVMRKHLSYPTTVTAMHDSNIAWSGIGSSLFTLYRNIYLPVSVSGTLLAVMYLGWIAVFHITTPALFSVQTFNASLSINMTVSGLPDYRNDTATTLYDEHLIPQSYIEVVRSLPEIDTVGLEGGTLYEAPSDSAGPGIANITATYFNMSCGYSPNITNDLEFYKTFSKIFVAGETSQGQEVSACDWNDDHGFCNLSPNATLLLGTLSFNLKFTSRANYMRSSQSLLDSIVVISSSIFADSDGEVKSVIDLDPPINYEVPRQPQNSSVSQLQVMRCQLGLNHYNATIDAQTRLLVSPVATPTKTLSRWRQISEGEVDVEDLVDSSLIEMMSIYSRQSSISNAFLAASDYCPTATGDMACAEGGSPALTLCMPEQEAQNQATCKAVFTPFEISVMKTLGLCADFIGYTELGQARCPYTPRQNLTLHDLENALSQTSAALFWADLKLPQALPDDHINDLKSPATMPISKLIDSVALISPASRLEISKVALLAGLGTTLLLLLLSIHLCAHEKLTLPGHPDSLGILQVLWLLRKQPDVHEVIGDVEDPTIDNLRAAGVSDISLGDEESRGE